MNFTTSDQVGVCFQPSHFPPLLKIFLLKIGYDRWEGKLYYYKNGTQAGTFDIHVPMLYSPFFILIYRY